MSPEIQSTAPTDFDFIIGEWRVHHCRLNSRLSGCTDWTESSGTSCTRKMDVPVVGSLTGSVGTFFANDSLGGKPITVRFTWHANPDDRPLWEQAFSADGGQTWETNGVMEFVRQ